MSKVIAQQQTTAAYAAQAAISFGLALGAMVVGVAYLPVEGWVRAFLGVGLLYVVTAAFTLAKVVRDRQEVGQVVSRVDQARLDKLLTEHDPFKVDGL
ncbi:YiaA/YiaB family inner membrane protein [Actinacidiphila sp. ITFR-21]|uniref:YiaA/YiaB family inner membrane protein n=1 Tax=Actinacidiphila sp. ITFR-21 TaxID=3075199 RepID=UPI00288900E8|nr:YiaA/YiaB family inner membrane protein [Streptomyces sp. ITFR-21]WNI18698.1 YiaA/YiaB family inner membrane protein [Streptomyces sp. ITFR-21]